MTLGDGIRRNGATISQEERDRLRDAFIALNKTLYPGTKNDNPAGGVRYWFKQDEIHQGTHVHGGPAFLPWHREIVNRLEALLRIFDPQLSLHYWDWTTDPRPLFTTDFMGNANGPAGDPGLAQDSTILIMIHLILTATGAEIQLILHLISRQVVEPPPFRL